MWQVWFAKGEVVKVALDIQDDCHKLWTGRNKCLEDLVGDRFQNVLQSQLAHVYARGLWPKVLPAGWVCVQTKDLERMDLTETILEPC
jgi:hypothetical protein